jgi:RND family efflux transporter MFP subunit
MVCRAAGNKMKQSTTSALALLAACLLLVWQVPVSAGPRVTAGPYRVELTTDPAVIPVGKARLIFKITDVGGKPVEGAQVRAIAQMPGMPMGEQEAVAQPQPGQPGVYAMPATFSMAGGYTAVVKITGPPGSAVAQIPLQTGQNTAAPAGGGFSPLALLPWLLGLGAVLFVLYRIWRTGQRPNWRGVFNRQVVGGLLLIAVMLAIAFFAVNKFRRPGSMTPIEAQGMEMSTPAPPGTAPVELATVQRGSVERTVRYTGQAVGFLEQEVTPRVRGYITWMPFYAGDPVQRGQVVARLDPSEVAPVVAERQAGVAIAEQGTAVARAEYRQALGAVSQAQAALGARKGALAEARSAQERARGALREALTEVNTTQGAVAEARGDLAAAGEERSGAEADLAAAQSQVPDADAQLQAARADLQYWTVQLGRTRVLLTEGAVSDEEYRRERAQAENAEAKVRQAQARVGQVQSQLRGAQSRVRKAEALTTSATAKLRQAHSRVEGSEARVEQAQTDITTMGARIEQALADLEAQRAGVRQVEAAANASRERINQAQAGVRQARATLGGATTAESFTAVRSQLDGVVTQRVLSPGTLANPGQTLLRVAQINPIRLQANVAESDLGRIRVGAPVTLREQADGTKPLSARVTSIAPAVDPVARTGIVEAVVPNRNGRFVPGEYVVMDLSTGRSTSTLYVPAPAVRWRTSSSTGGNGTAAAAYVWVATPLDGQTSQFTVRQVDVSVGISSGTTTEVRTGLAAGQQVVVSGQDYLKNGDTVAPVSPVGEKARGDLGAPAPEGTSGQPSRPAAGKQLYTCPMHPEVVRDRPGDCPKCGMKLVPKPSALGASAEPGATGVPPAPKTPGAGDANAPPSPAGVPGITPALPPNSARGMGSSGMAPGGGAGGMGGTEGPGTSRGMSPGGPPGGSMGRVPSMGSGSGMASPPGRSGMGRTNRMPAMGGPSPVLREMGGEMPSGGIPGLPPRGGVPLSTPPSAQPAPRSNGARPGMVGPSGSGGMSGGRPASTESRGPQGMTGMGAGK